MPEIGVREGGVDGFGDGRFRECPKTSQEGQLK